MELDTEAFIYEIQQRQAIWDVSSEGYSNREKKKNAWEELVNIFINSKEEPSNDEKKQFGQQIQRRWKSLRDCYSRELKIQREVKSGSESRKRPVYVFFKQLSFLEKTFTSKENSNSLVEEEEQGFPSSLPSPIPKKQKTKQDPVCERLVSAVERSVISREERERELENDSDRMFLLSLLSPLKQIPEHARFGVKRKLMEVIDAEMNIYRPTLTPQMNPSPFQQHSSISSLKRTYSQLQNVNQPCHSNFIATQTDCLLVQRPPSADQSDSISTYASTPVASPFSEMELF